MNTDIKETLISAIQRDRIPELLKKSDESHRGACFYFSLIEAFNFLYPSIIIPKELESFILKGVNNNKDFGVFPDEFIPEVKRLQRFLKMKVSKVDVIAGQSSVDDVRKVCNIPDYIPVVKIRNPQGVNAIDEKSTAVIFMQNDDDRAHYLHTAISNRFQGLEKPHGAQHKGGQSEYNVYESNGYTPTVVFHLTRTE